MDILGAVLRTMTKNRGHRRWTLFLRATGLLGLLCIPLALFVEGSIPYVWLGLIGLPANSPLSPILPTVWDPMLMELAKYKPPISVATAAVAIYMYTEYLNWHVYRWVLNWDRLAPLRNNRWVRWGIRLFGQSPALAVLLFAATPLPFWVVRSLAILKRYSIVRFMTATAIGRWPRFFMYAWLGDALRIPSWVILLLIVVPCVAVIIARISKHEPLLEDAVLDSESAEAVVTDPPVAPGPLEPASQ